MSGLIGLWKRVRQEGQQDISEATTESPGKCAGSVEKNAQRAEMLVQELHSAGEKVSLHAVRSFDLKGADRRVRNVLDPQTIVGELYRVLRAKLSLMHKQRGLKTLLVTSTVVEEGKTLTACCLAGVLAQEPGSRVLLIDADLRKAGASRLLGLDGQDHLEGLCHVLRGEAAVLDKLLISENMGLSFLPAGQIPSNPAELLSGPNLERVLNDVAQLFDWVVIDSSPIIPVADSSLLAPLCDGVLLVVRANATPVKLIKDSIERIGRDRICGVLMNRVQRLKSSRYYYGYRGEDHQ